MTYPEIKGWMKEDMEARVEEYNLQRNGLTSLLQKCTETLQGSLEAGEVAVAEDMYYQKISLLQKILGVCDQKHRVVESVLIHRKPLSTDEAELMVASLQDLVVSSRDLTTCLGKLMYKKEAQVGALNQKILYEQCNLQLCIDRFDPNAKKHAAAKKALQDDVQTIEEEVLLLKEQQDSAVLVYEKAYHRLQEWEGPKHAHPMDQVQDELIKRKTELLQYRLVLNLDEQDHILTERDNISQQAAKLVAEGRSPRKDAPTSYVTLIEDDLVSLKLENEDLQRLLREERTTSAARIAQLEHEVATLHASLSKMPAASSHSPERHGPQVVQACPQR
eukprot:NODE_557_length_1556_cov_94.342402_g406_i0.p1 GENE.NODE_557_length_1556_cov_94.342402_g406_i0~~NODE_557_length_1556_cov_94.342402_g406_i0.p1  ORF type:complete len:333 (+),score=64.10 NODE_557_length_1556_cov_94.342402_g406_i0:112-1110(+)